MLRERPADGGAEGRPHGLPQRKVGPIRHEGDGDPQSQDHRLDVEFGVEGNGGSQRDHGTVRHSVDGKAPPRYDDHGRWSLMSFQFNRDFEKAIMAEVSKGIEKENVKTQRALDAVSRQYGGRPKSVVEPQVRRAVRGTVLETKDGIATFTDMIVSGNRPVLRLEG